MISKLKKSLELTTSKTLNNQSFKSKISINLIEDVTNKAIELYNFSKTNDEDFFVWEAKVYTAFPTNGPTGSESYDLNSLKKESNRLNKTIIPFLRTHTWLTLLGFIKPTRIEDDMLIVTFNLNKKTKYFNEIYQAVINQTAEYSIAFESKPMNKHIMEISFVPYGNYPTKTLKIIKHSNF